MATDNTGTALEAGVAAGSDAIGNVLTDGVPDSDAGIGTNLTVSAIRTGTEAGGGTEKGEEEEVDPADLLAAWR